MSRPFVCFSLSVLSIVWSLGCSSGQMENPDWPERYAASGTVTWQGKPVEGADVTFMSDSGNSTAVGKTDSAGRFVLTTHVDGDGAVAGPQKVAVRRVNIVDKTPKDVDLSAGGVALPPEITWIVPEEFSNPATSGLTAVVNEDGPNEYTFDLK